MKVIVTGSEGFLGTELCKWLSREHKCEVIRCDFALRGANHDITDKKTIAHLFTPDVDACVHLAAVSNLNYYSDDEKKSGDINVRGTRNVMDLCDQHKIKMFFASTCCLYGDNGVAVSSERSRVSPTDPYAVSKMESEKMIRDHNKNRSLPKVVSMRLATFYGGRNARGALAISIAIEKLSKGEVFTVHGNGNMKRTYTHVLDVVSGIAALVMNKDSLRYDLYNVTRQDSYSVWDILSEVSKHTPNKVCSFKIVDNRKKPFSQEKISNGRLRQVGWVPKWSWERGIAEAYGTFVKRNKGKWLR